jgi:fibronectin type 3 domain-containing protein
MLVTYLVRMLVFAVTVLLAACVDASTPFHPAARSPDAAIDGGGLPIVGDSSAGIGLGGPLEPLPGRSSLLVATVVSATEIDLTWPVRLVSDAGFRVERRIPGQTFRPIATVGAEVRNHADRGLSPGHTYEYRLRLLAGEADAVYTATATTPATAGRVPAAPSNTTAEALAPTSVRVTWSDNSDNEAEFQVQRRVTSGGTADWELIATPSANATLLLDNHVSGGTRYRYRVRACNGAGCSGYDSSNQVWTPIEDPDAEPPAAPSDLAAGAVSSSQIDLTWQDNSSDETGFEIQRHAGDGQWATVHTAAANALAWSNTGLQPSTAYHYRVRAIKTSAPASGWSNTATAATHPSGPPPPLMHSLTDDFAGTVVNTDRWQFYRDPSRAQQNNRLIVTLTPSVAGYGGLLYRLPHRFAGSSFMVEISQVAAGGPLTETAIAVSSEDEEEYAVISSLNGRIGAYAKWRGENWYRFRVAPDLPFDPVAHRFRRIREQGGTIFYELSPDGFNWTQPPGWSEPHRFTSLDVLHGGAVAGAYMADPNAGTAIFENVNTTVPAIPSNLAATAVSGTQINLTWFDRSANEQGFRIERRQPGGSFEEIATVGASTTSFPNTGLEPSTTYEFRVRAYNGSGSSAYSNVASAATSSEPPPAAPSNTAAAALSASQIQVTWSDNSPNEAGFEVQRRVTSGTTTDWATIGTAPANATGYLDTGLSGGVRYRYRVRACNAAGCSSWDASPQVWTPSN